jgi:hypothetical protein
VSLFTFFTTEHCNKLHNSQVIFHYFNKIVISIQTIKRLSTATRKLLSEKERIQAFTFAEGFDLTINAIIWEALRYIISNNTIFNLSEFSRYLWSYFWPKLIKYNRNHAMVASAVAIKPTSLCIIQDPRNCEYAHNWTLSITDQGQP